MSSPRLSILALFLFATLAARGTAQTVLYRDFTSTTGLTRNSVSVSGGAITLADNANDRGSVFTSSTYSISSFSAAFEFRITNPGGGTDSFNQQGADGLAFVIQRAQANALGSSGEGLGYLGINQSVAVEFDTWFNSTRADPDSNHYGLDLNGSVNSVVTAAESTRFDNGQKWSVWVDYNGTALEVRASTTGVRPTTASLTYGTAQNPFDLATAIGGANAYIGFTGATGSATGTHQLLSFAFSDTYVPGGISVIPEPSTYALFGLGLGLVGVAAWRRRRG
ncbi:MAG: PEP-CTERM sorting domain-containing protein [Opitutae bacterium]|nr:PEP-CTERM sorting domain-containing protein [Opitutae bacterium]